MQCLCNQHHTAWNDFHLVYRYRPDLELRAYSHMEVCRFSIAVRHMLIVLHSVLEVNTGIMCACLLSLPVFLKHRAKRLSSGFSRLITYVSSRFTRSDTATSAKPWQPNDWLEGKPTGGIEMDSGGYTRLTKVSIEAQKSSVGAASRSNEDIEAWPRQSRDTERRLLAYPKTTQSPTAPAAKNG